ncbi:hypothetical protein EVAR_6568_1 [Eumeta japonica]|uniref:Uncharacterized protein n=1 Tax=Eumeta variegata TaxID=151549 RepID=A0A4C1ST44_EUMVA|nr:hypothetical protein EVAR_6568_1 [Eumeta japonica]
MQAAKGVALSHRSPSARRDAAGGAVRARRPSSFRQTPERRVRQRPGPRRARSNDRASSRFHRFPIVQNSILSPYSTRRFHVSNAKLSCFSIEILYIGGWVAVGVAECFAKRTEPVTRSPLRCLYQISKRKLSYMARALLDPASVERGVPRRAPATGISEIVAVFVPIRDITHVLFM